MNERAESTALEETASKQKRDAEVIFNVAFIRWLMA
jgi:hypothetical protein